MPVRQASACARAGEEWETTRPSGTRLAFDITNLTTLFLGALSPSWPDRGTDGRPGVPRPKVLTASRAGAADATDSAPTICGLLLLLSPCSRPRRSAANAIVPLLATLARRLVSGRGVPTARRGSCRCAACCSCAARRVAPGSVTGARLVSLLAAPKAARLQALERTTTTSSPSPAIARRTTLPGGQSTAGRGSAPA